MGEKQEGFLESSEWNWGRTFGRLATQDSMDTASSGAEVPKPITAMPIINGETPNDRATTSAPSTKRLALHVRRNRPPMINAIESQRGMFEYIKQVL